MLKEFLKLMKRLKHSGKTIVACPKCGSTNIHQTSILNVWLLPSYWICKDCGYKGPIVMEIDVEQEDFGKGSKGRLKSSERVG